MKEAFELFVNKDIHKVPFLRLLFLRALLSPCAAPHPPAAASPPHTRMPSRPSPVLLRR